MICGSLFWGFLLCGFKLCDWGGKWKGSKSKFDTFLCTSKLVSLQWMGDTRLERRKTHNLSHFHITTWCDGERERKVHEVWLRLMFLCLLCNFFLIWNSVWFFIWKDDLARTNNHIYEIKSVYISHIEDIPLTYDSSVGCGPFPIKPSLSFLNEKNLRFSILRLSN